MGRVAVVAGRVVTQVGIFDPVARTAPVTGSSVGTLGPATLDQHTGMLEEILRRLPPVA